MRITPIRNHRKSKYVLIFSQFDAARKRKAKFMGNFVRWLTHSLTKIAIMRTHDFICKLRPRVLDLATSLFSTWIRNYIHENVIYTPWWRAEMEAFSALLAPCAWNSSVIGEVPAQRPVMRYFDIFFDLHLNKRLSEQCWCWWFEMPSCSLWLHCNAITRWQCPASSNSYVRKRQSETMPIHKPRILASLLVGIASALSHHESYFPFSVQIVIW